MLAPSSSDVALAELGFSLQSQLWTLPTCMKRVARQYTVYVWVEARLRILRICPDCDQAHDLITHGPRHYMAVRSRLPVLKFQETLDGQNSAQDTME